MDTRPLLDSLRRCAHFADLQDDELQELAWMCRPFEADTGQVLFQQGDLADSMILITQGRVEIRMRMPGDEVLPIATLVAGQSLGDLALLDDGDDLRSGTAIALEPVRGLQLTRNAFQVVRESYRPWAARVLRSIAQHGIDVLADMNRRIQAAQEDDRVTVQLPPCEEATERIRTQPFIEDSDWVSPNNLSCFPMLKSFSKPELAELIDHGHTLVVPRHTVVLREGEEPFACYLVIRGALQITTASPNARKVALLGPGSLLGQMAFLKRAPRNASAFTRESSVLLGLPIEVCERLFHGVSPAAIKLLDLTVWLLAQSIRRTNRHLARLVVEGRE